MIEPGQIYFFPKVKVGQAEYGRPGLVLRVSKSDASIAYFSTRFDLKEPHEVAILDSDPEFKASGLRESSYIVDQPAADVDLSFFKDAKLRGRATGHFKKNSEDWYGASIGQ